MGRRSIKHIRRSELSEAAYHALIEHGIRGTTLEKVADVAGVSKGIVLHYFKDKESLFEAVLRRSNTVLRLYVIALLRHAETPWERMYGIVLGNFSPQLFRQEVCHAWISLCAEVPYNKQCLRIQTVIHSRMRSNVKDALRPVVDDEERLEHIAMQFTSLIDGLWLRASLSGQPYSREDALEEVYFAIDHMMPAGKKVAHERKEARKKMELVDQIVSSTQNSSGHTMTA